MEEGPRPSGEPPAPQVEEASWTEVKPRKAKRVERAPPPSSRHRPPVKQLFSRDTRGKGRWGGAKGAMEAGLEALDFQFDEELEQHSGRRGKGDARGDW